MVDFLTSWQRGPSLLLLCLLLIACSNQQSPSETAVSSSESQLIIFSAASLAEAFTALGDAYETEHPNVGVVLNFAGSQQLAQQLAQGAPADLFASANERQMKAVMTAGRVDSGSERIFTANRLVIIYPADNPADLHSLTDLAKPDLRLILAAPEVPVGQYAQDFLDKTAAAPEYGPAYAESVRSNIVSFEENVRAVLSKVILGEADGGIVYQSDLNSVTADSLGQLAIPDDLNVIATYPIAPINDSEQSALATAFLKFVLSPAGQAILADYGFSPPT